MGMIGPLASSQLRVPTVKEVKVIQPGHLAVSLQWLDSDGREHEKLIPAKHFQGRAEKAIALLLDGGAYIPISGSKPRRYFIDYVIAQIRDAYYELQCRGKIEPEGGIDLKSARRGVHRAGEEWSYFRRKDSSSFAVLDLRRRGNHLQVLTCEGWLEADNDQFSVRHYIHNEWRLPIPLRILL